MDNPTVSGTEEREKKVPRMYFVVNRDLKMGKGKIAAQVAHAAIALARRLDVKNKVHQVWERTYQAKIVLGANDQTFQKLIPICDHIVQDMGFTQIACGSQTVLAWLPMEEQQVPDQLKQLKLL